ncbi:MAG: PfkB family carbohydrate kinase, partial [Bacteroidota bacterium]|nr:PfkB family carbohydrate kinase [Bacteroidota bacterium]
VIESLGGVYFPVAAFGAVVRGHDTVRPCFPVGEDAWERFRDAMALFPRVDLAGCRPIGLPNTRVRLFHDACAEYNTQLVCSLPPIPDDLFSPFVGDADLVYINFMTGEDLTVGSAERLRRMTRALVYLDVHMIAYRVGFHGHRTPHPVDEWRQWVSIADVIQCNRRELAVFVPDHGDEASRAAAVLEASRVRWVVVTKGGDGVSVYSTDG